jgi:aminopeptidase N
MGIGVSQQLLLQARSAIEQFGAPSKRHEYRDHLISALLKQLPSAPAGGDHQLAFVRNVIALARTSEHVALLKSWLDGSATPTGLTIDTDLRWAFVSRLASLGELARDNTAGGQRQAASARAALPTADAKAKAWASVVESDELPNAILNATVGGFAQPDQRELLVPYVDKYFAALTKIWQTRTNEIAQSLTTGLFPSLLASEDILQRADKFLANDKDAGSTRLVKELRDNVARSLRCQAKDS